MGGQQQGAGFSVKLSLQENSFVIAASPDNAFVRASRATGLFVRSWVRAMIPPDVEPFGGAKFLNAASTRPFC